LRGLEKEEVLTRDDWDEEILVLACGQAGSVDDVFIVLRLVDDGVF